MYLIVGASGFLGGYFLKNILKISNEKIVATYNQNMGILKNDRIIWEKLDIADFRSIDNFTSKLNSGGNRYKIIYLSSYHHPDLVMKNFQYAWQINITGLSYFINKLNCIESLYYSSTEMVYGESVLGKAFEENDSTNPINEYALQKTVAEKIVLTLGYNVVRYSILMGKGINGKKHFTDIIIEEITRKNGIEMMTDSYRNMIDFDQASRLTLQLMNKYNDLQVGIVNIAADDTISKYDMALQLAEEENLDSTYIKPLRIEENSFFNARRAKLLVLSNAKLKKLLDIHSIKLNFKRKEVIL